MDNPLGWANGAVASAAVLHTVGRGFESLFAHHFFFIKSYFSKFSEVAFLLCSLFVAVLRIAIWSRLHPAEITNSRSHGHSIPTESTATGDYITRSSASPIGLTSRPAKKQKLSGTRTAEHVWMDPHCKIGFLRQGLNTVPDVGGLQRGPCAFSGGAKERIFFPGRNFSRWSIHVSR